MSLKSNYSFIRDWINAKFLKKEDVDLTQYQTHEEVQADYQYIDQTYAKKTDLNGFLTEDDEQIIAASLTDLDRRIEDLPNSGVVLGEKEEKVIAEALIDLNNRVGVIEEADYGSQLLNAGKVNSVTLNNVPAVLDNKVAKLALMAVSAGTGNAVTGLSIDGNTITVNKGNIDVSDKESVSNKVTTITSSSTDVQYPSAKCMYTLVGEVESVLDEIITPKPQLSVTDTFEMDGVVGSTTQSTFRVYGDYLTANVGMAKTGENAAMFVLTPTSVTKDNALAGQDVTIKYTPTGAGTHTATITFTSTNADPKVMTVTGTAVNSE